MKIGLFPLWTGTQIGGIATYDAELVPALAQAAPNDEFHVFSAKRAPEQTDHTMTNLKHRRLWPSSRWVNVPISFPIAASFSPVQLVHMTHVPPPVFLKPYVMTLHCFSTFAHPEFYPRALCQRMNALTRRGLKGARVVVCVSKGLRDLAQTELKVSPERTAVAFNGISDAFRPVPKDQAHSNVKAKYGLDAPYLLFVGVIAPRKNVVRLIRAFHLFRNETRSQLRLVLVGRRWLAQDVDEAISKLGLQQQITFIDHVENRSLPDLYSAAEALVFPSLWESFGIPVMEAMACGTPVLTSRGSCLPEIAGDAAVLVDPYSSDEIAQGIASIVQDPLLRDTLRQKGLARSKEFTWASCADQTLAAYRQALSV